MKIMIKICKIMKIKKIELSDSSHLYCNKYSIDLKILYTMTHGYPWYYQFGFRYENESDHNIVLSNKKILYGKKVKEFNYNVFIDDEYIKIAKKYNDVLISLFIDKLSKEDCLKFQKYYLEIYTNLGLKQITNKSMCLFL